VLHRLLAAYRTEENFGGKKLWRMNLAADLAKKKLWQIGQSLRKKL